VEWGAKGIRFNAIAPGPFPTEGAWARLSPGQTTESSQTVNSIPINRVGRMPELANLAVYLLHPMSEYVNGQTIAIDGGAWNAGGGSFGVLRDWTDEQWTQAREMIQGANAQDRAKRTV
jgi:NAD(P)-dependent dehydrogenase (short-subunit alcohol dehydrogenase family)